MSDSVAWAISEKIVDYEAALAAMEERVRTIHDGKSPELIWLLEHPPLYTSGTSAKPSDISNPLDLPVFDAGRGGQFTYHGPGQRVAYVMLNVAKRGRDVRQFIQNIENWIIASLAEFNLKGELRDGRVGVWIDRSQPGETLREDKIAAIGVRLHKWISFHGMSLNVEPDLTHFSGITPCGITEDGLGVTSLADLGLTVTMPEVDAALRRSFEGVFGVETYLTSPPLDDAK